MTIAEVPNLLPALPEMFLAVAAMALLMVGVFQPADDGMATTVQTSRSIARLGIAALVVTAAVVLVVAPDDSVTTFGGLFVVDGFAVFFKVLVLAASALCLIVAQDFLELHRIARFEFSILVLLATLGMMMMISANDFMALYLGLEMQSLSLYVIASFHRDDVRSVEAGLKYFVLGALASGTLLYGASLVYGFTGSTSFATITEVLGAQGDVPVGLIIGIVFILAGLAFKVSAVPFHMWTPDVYEGSPTPVTAFFSIAPKLAAIALFLRVMLEPFGDLVAQWRQIVTFVSIASMVLGAFAAIGQTNIKRLMAYSSIGHIGYALIGLAVGNQVGLESVLIYMMIYVVMNLGVFCCILCMRRRDQMVVEIADLAGLAKTNGRMALALAIFMFSMAGIPPLAGFFGKLYVFRAAADAGLWTLAIIGLLSSVVAAYYYIRIVKAMYFEDAADALDRGFGREIRLVMLGSATVIVLFFLYPEPVLSSAAAAASALFAP
jgi:NADH-quinone oxidoreductase subunit N